MPAGLEKALASLKQGQTEGVPKPVAGDFKPQPGTERMMKTVPNMDGPVSNWIPKPEDAEVPDEAEAHAEEADDDESPAAEAKPAEAPKQAEEKKSEEKPKEDDLGLAPETPPWVKERLSKLTNRAKEAETKASENSKALQEAQFLREQLDSERRARVEYEQKVNDWYAKNVQGTQNNSEQERYLNQFDDPHERKMAEMEMRLAKHEQFLIQQSQQAQQAQEEARKNAASQSAMASIRRDIEAAQQAFGRTGDKQFAWNVLAALRYGDQNRDVLHVAYEVNQNDIQRARKIAETDLARNTAVDNLKKAVPPSPAAFASTSSPMPKAKEAAVPEFGKGMEARRKQLEYMAQHGMLRPSE